MERNNLHKEGEYYVVLLGNFHTPSPHTGFTYEINSNLHKEIARLNKMRTLYCTLGGPTRRAHATSEDAIIAFQNIEMDDICALVRNVHMRYEDDQAFLLGQLRFAGPKGQIAKDMFAEPGKARMAMRSLLKPTVSTHKEIDRIITFDLVYGE